MPKRSNLTLDRLRELPLEDLRNEWARHYGTPAPALSPELLRLGLGHRMQERRHGSLSRECRALLRHAARNAGEDKAPAPRKLTVGTRLVRDWHGVGHTVTVLNDGFEYDGKTWPSLTAIARTITGTHWNGPRFFGLTGDKR